MKKKQKNKTNNGWNDLKWYKGNTTDRREKNNSNSLAMYISKSYGKDYVGLHL